MYCYNCGEQVLHDNDICDNCHVNVLRPLKEFDFDPKKMIHPEEYRASPGVAALLSLFIWGLGHLVNGQRFKGWLLIALSLLFYGYQFYLEIVKPVGADWVIILVGNILPLIITAFVAIEAAIQATELKDGKPVYKYRFFSTIKSES